jgi:hypothetical protein
VIAAFEEWVKELSSALGLADDVDTDALLDVARDVAHGVERRAAPVTTFLIGLSAGLAGGGIEAERRALATARELAAGWTATA